MNKNNPKFRSDLVNFLSDLESDKEEPTEEIKNSYINILIQKTDKKLRIKVSAKKTSRNTENLEDLTETASGIGEIERVEEMQGNNDRDYNIILRINPNEFGTNLIEILKQKIKQYERLCKKMRDFMGLTEFNCYLGNWRNGELRLRHRVGEDLSKLYPILEDKLKVSLKDVYKDFKSENIPAARAIISFFLRNKYDKLSLSTIGKIIKKNHATIIVGIKKFNGLILNPEDYEDVTKFFDKVIKNYKGRLKYKVKD